MVAAILHQLVDVRAELVGRLSHFVSMAAQLERQEVGQRIAPLGEQTVVLTRYTEDLAHHFDREVVGEL